ncbi:MAG: amylo-alpha-1,6-glucosidase [Bdellovibrionales bacterium]|jgi:glycogen debranching enzyme|nr:amylo-alpha-1,6-glucosidase [Bdellovibrionales bacterium]
MFVLKHNDSFAIIDEHGDMLARNEIDHHIADGLICRDTRLLSRSELRINGAAPLLVDSYIDSNNTVFEAKFQISAEQEQPEIWRSIFLWQDALYEEISIVNHSGEDVALRIGYIHDADFKDLFELRGAKRPQEGTRSPACLTDTGMRFDYTGVDERPRSCCLSFSQSPEQIGGDVSFAIDIPAGETRSFYLCASHIPMPVDADVFDTQKSEALAHVQAQLDRRAEITSSNPAFDEWTRQNAVDIALLTTQTPQGLYPYAGTPWYSTAFGRDGIITAFELLWQDPEIAHGVLGFLAAHQAEETSAFHDSAPGKILHEIRMGEMAACGEIPHTPYYGTADATPLFVFLAGAYLDRTGDTEFIQTIWPNIESALMWIDTHGDIDGDGFVEYLRGAETGLGNQGWKDSQDAISHEDGELARGSIALCEVQGYVYAAKRAAAGMARRLGLPDRAAVLLQQAENLKNHFNDVFWQEDMGTYALALDGDKKPCRVKASNAGHLLFCGIVPEDRALRVMDVLMSDDMFSGFGIRTLGAGEKRYEPVKNPEGYHNGTVWTHDTALCAAGMAKYGCEERAAKLMTGLFDAAQHFPQMRLPELFGGLPRDANGTPPAAYPVACNPQAWASAAESLLLQSMLGLGVDGGAKTVTLHRPHLPRWLTELEISGLRIGDGMISLRLQRHDDGIDITRTGGTPDIHLNIEWPEEIGDIRHTPRQMQGT